MCKPKIKDYVHLWMDITLGYSRENLNREGGLGYTFLTPPPFPWNFSFFYFTPGKNFRQQNKAQPLDIPQNCVRFLGNSKAKNKDPWKFHIIFSWLSLEIPLRF